MSNTARVAEAVTSTARPAARTAFAGGWALIVAPLIAHGLWRPLISASGGRGDAADVTLAALAVAAVSVAAGWRWPDRAGRALASSSGAALVAALVIAAAGASSGGALAAGVVLLAVAALISAILPRLVARLPAALDGLARVRVASTIAVALVMALGVVQSARLSTFMGDAARIEAAATSPILPHLGRHACVTAYLQAAKLASRGVDNLYDAGWWPEEASTSEGVIATEGVVAAEAAAYAPFGLDVYAYPPPFLLLPRAILAVSDDFAVQRALWFGLHALGWAFALLFVPLWIVADRRAGLRPLLLGPLLWSSFSALIVLQVGNVHVTVLAAAVIAMIAFEAKRPALGGALLAFAILAKIAPGLLGIVLLVQRRWRDALWTAGFGLGWSLLALAVFGPAPFEAFVTYELPRLSSGAALDFFADSLLEIGNNLAPFGIPFKLQALGVDVGDVWARAATVGAAFTVLVVALTIVAARRQGDRRIRVGLWLAILTLGALRSPFAPGYVVISALWLMTLWAAEIRRPVQAAGLILLFVAVTGLPLTGTAHLLYSFVHATALLATVVWFIVRTPKPAATAEAAAPST